MTSCCVSCCINTAAMRYAIVNTLTKLTSLADTMSTRVSLCHQAHLPLRSKVQRAFQQHRISPNLAAAMACSCNAMLSSLLDSRHCCSALVYLALTCLALPLPLTAPSVFIDLVLFVLACLRHGQNTSFALQPRLNDLSASPQPCLL